MQKTAIDSLMPRVRQTILAATLLDPQRRWYVSELARHLRARPSSLQRELVSLVSAGILKSHRAGRMVYVHANTESPIFQELRGLLMKTAGLVDVLREALEPSANHIRVAFVYGSIARHEEHAQSDVDLL